MRLNKTALLTLIAVIAAAFAAPAGVFANEAYNGYIYNYLKESVPSANGYVPKKVLTGDSLGAGFLKTPQDIFITGSGDMYILDSGNKRIIITDPEYKLKKIIKEIRINGKSDELSNNAGGLFVGKDGMIYVADTGKDRVLAMNDQGEIQKVYGKPSTALIADNLQFKPVKLVVDGSGVLYVLSKSVNTGAVQMSPEGKFIGFFGANRITPTLEVITEYFWRKILTREQVAQMKTFQPIEYSNLDIDERNFVFATAFPDKKMKGSELKELNPRGDNILPDKNYGDLETRALEENEISPYDKKIVDVAVDEEDFVNIIDRGMGRVFQYDRQGNLIFIFGGVGDQRGTFRSAAAVEVDSKGRILILDNVRGDITVFQTTAFGNTVRKAVTLYNEGLYQEALVPWKEVISMNSNYELAYRGVGRALILTGNFKEAMKYFKLGNDKEQYSRAKKEYRALLMQENLPFILTAAILLCILWWFLKKKSRLIDIIRMNKAGKQL